LILGPNGSGKTTILEGVGFFAFGRFQSVRGDFSAVSRGEEAGTLEAEIFVDGGKKHSRIAITRSQNIVKIEENRIPSSKIIGFIKAVFFNPETVNLVFGSPQLRRRELDLVIAQSEKNYVEDLLRYKNILKQRNNLLRRISLKLAKKDELGFWDNELAREASAIIKARTKLIAKINRGISEVHGRLSERESKLKTKYIPSTDYERFGEALVASYDQDLKEGNTAVGPHRDDFEFVEANVALRDQASRGEQRIAAVSYKLRTMSYLEEATGEKAVMILDDVFSELDSQHREAVAKVLGENQTFISSTDDRAMPESLRRRAKEIVLE